LDLHVSSAAEQTAEAERLMALGAERVGWDSYPDDPDFIVLADPDGPTWHPSTVARILAAEKRSAATESASAVA
jgi:hypothetical protein